MACQLARVKRCGGRLQLSPMVVQMHKCIGVLSGGGFKGDVNAFGGGLEAKEDTTE
jgi:hypothetical protein